MLKNEKGISLITLIITLVVMVILISVIVNSSLDSVEETNLTKINNEIKNIKDAVATRIVDNARNESLYPIVGERVGDSVYGYIRSIEHLSVEEKTNLLNKVAKTYTDETKDYFRKIGRDDAKILGVEGIDSEHFYIIDYYECEVYGPVGQNLVNSEG